MNELADLRNRCRHSVAWLTDMADQGEANFAARMRAEVRGIELAISYIEEAMREEEQRDDGAVLYIDDARLEPMISGGGWWSFSVCLRYEDRRAPDLYAVRRALGALEQVTYEAKGLKVDEHMKEPWP